MESCNRTRSCSGERRMELVREVIRKEVQDWDSEVMISARFKAFSGQRSDWEPRYHFWRDLVIKIARRLRIFIIRPSVVSGAIPVSHFKPRVFGETLINRCFFLQVKNVWFNQGGLTPLCIDDVLVSFFLLALVFTIFGVCCSLVFILTKVLHRSSPSSKCIMPATFHVATILSIQKAANSPSYSIK